jgi:hypothetical protein
MFDGDPAQVADVHGPTGARRGIEGCRIVAARSPTGASMRGRLGRRAGAALRRRAPESPESPGVRQRRRGVS